MVFEVAGVDCSYNIWRILSQFETPEKAQYQELPGALPPATSARALPIPGEKNDSENSLNLPLQSKCPISATDYTSDGVTVCAHARKRKHVW